MLDSSQTNHQILEVNTFQELVTVPFQGDINAICFSRNLEGDFEEIVNKLKLKENITEISLKKLLSLQLTAQGNLARKILINDINSLKANGASPSLNLLKCYEKDDSFLPTDVYSFHVDRSPIPTNTYLCTYYGEPSELVPNAQASQKIRIPEIRSRLKELHNDSEETFEEFLSDYFFDLHYQADADAQIVNLGLGNLWRLAVDHPDSKVLPCIHRAPIEKDGKTRLLLIC